MKQANRTKLSLDRQTVRRLDPAALTAVIGGGGDPTPPDTHKQEPLPNPY